MKLQFRVYKFSLHYQKCRTQAQSKPCKSESDSLKFLSYQPRQCLPYHYLSIIFNSTNFVIRNFVYYQQPSLCYVTSIPPIIWINHFVFDINEVQRKKEKKLRKNLRSFCTNSQKLKDRLFYVSTNIPSIQYKIINRSQNDYYKVIDYLRSTESLLSNHQISRCARLLEGNKILQKFLEKVLKEPGYLLLHQIFLVVFLTMQQYSQFFSPGLSLGQLRQIVRYSYLKGLVTGGPEVILLRSRMAPKIGIERYKRSIQAHIETYLNYLILTTLLVCQANFFDPNRNQFPRKRRRKDDEDDQPA